MLTHERYRTAADGTTERDYAKEYYNAVYREKRRSKIVSLLVISGVAAGAVWGTIAAKHDDKSPIEKPAVVHKAPKPTPKLEELTIQYGKELLRCTIDPTPYDVQKGDSLWIMAEEHKAANQVAPVWLAVEAMNKDLLVHPGNYNLIYPNQQLKVPATCAPVAQ